MLGTWREERCGLPKTNFGRGTAHAGDTESTPLCPIRTKPPPSEVTRGTGSFVAKEGFVGSHDRLQTSSDRDRPHRRCAGRVLPFKTRGTTMSLPERLVNPRTGKVIWGGEGNALPDPGTLVREIRSPDGFAGAAVFTSKHKYYCYRLLL